MYISLFVFTTYFLHFKSSFSPLFGSNPVFIIPRVGSYQLRYIHFGLLVTFSTITLTCDITQILFMPVTTMIGEGMTTIDKIIVDSMMAKGMIIDDPRILTISTKFQGSWWCGITGCSAAIVCKGRGSKKVFPSDFSLSQNTNGIHAQIFWAWITFHHVKKLGSRVVGVQRKDCVCMYM